MQYSIAGAIRKFSTAAAKSSALPVLCNVLVGGSWWLTRTA